MFRLLVLLCGAIFVAMVVGGQDRGQKRFGLMAEPEVAPIVVVAIEEPKPVDTVAIVPAQPLIVVPVVAEVVSATPAGRVLYIATARVNVRQGPGKDHAVVGRLTRGEAVLEVVAGEGPDGWTLIRVEGDGVEGYVASRLLSE